MKKLLIFLAGLLSYNYSVAQVSTYTHSQQNEKYKSIEDRGVQYTDHWMGEDFVWPEKVKIPFPFKYGSGTYDSIGISENGFVWFGLASGTDISHMYPISTQHPVGVTGVVAALGGDLHPHDTTYLTSRIHSAVVGTAPFRIFAVEWLYTGRGVAAIDPAGEDTMTFQIRLYETSGRIDFAYGDFKLNANVSDQFEIGLRGSKASDYNNLITGPSLWNNLVSGTSAINACVLEANKKPAPGKVIMWVPNGSTAVAELQGKEKELTVFPAPATDHIEVRGPDGQILSGEAYSIRDITGRQQTTGYLNKGRVNITNINAGIYVLSLRLTDGHIVHKRFEKAAF